MYRLIEEVFKHLIVHVNEVSVRKLDSCVKIKIVEGSVAYTYAIHNDLLLELPVVSGGRSIARHMIEKLERAQ